MTKLSVKDVQSHDVYWVEPDSTVLEAAKLMNEKNVGGIIVEDEARPIGIITERDIVQRVVAEKKEPNKIKVRGVMTSPVLTIRPEASLSEAVQKMIKGNVKRLVVIDDSFRTIGVISYSDILEATPDLLDVLSMEACPDEFKADTFSGYCQRCNEWSEHLYENEDGEFLCKSCLQL
ncbi:MAG: CBS domain-containing protein [Candidatus Helarchaeales archaeon]